MAKKKAAKKKVAKKKVAKKKATRKKKILPPAEFLTSSPESKAVAAEQNSEVTVDTPMPFYLEDAYGDSAVKMWTWIVRVLAKSRLVAPVDIFEVALLVEAHCQAHLLRAMIYPNNILTETYRGVMAPNPLMVRLETALGTVHKISCKFGMTPVDRSGRKDLEVAEKDDEIQTIND